MVMICVSAAFAMTIKTHAAYVTPQMGGGQASAPMKHLDVAFDGTNISVHIDDTVDIPMLRPLTPPDEFDPNEPWAVLTGKAYNFQYGWNPSGFITLPTDSGIWIKRLDQDPELEVYARPPATPAYAPLFENNGDIWQWGGAMTHNVYAVLDPTASVYTTTYQVYIGDASTGAMLPGYGSDDVTLTFNATPIPEPVTLGMLVLSAGALLLHRR